MNIGARPHGTNDDWDFTVWAPLRDRVEVKIVAPEARTVPMDRDEHGYWRTRVKGLPPGAKYFYRLDGEKERPDPASRYQPDGVHGPSQIVLPDGFLRQDGDWKGVPLQNLVLYELHVGTFTHEGTFDAIILHLDDLRDLGVTAVELMPIAQFPGARNWGYDGAYPYAVQNSYGGPAGLMTFVNACHGKGLAVVLDVVYNHLGPEGNYLWDYGPYFTDRYKTPWGEAINFDGPYSDDVRRYFVGSALAWVTDYHIDALRIDAIHGIFDFSAKHFLKELGEVVHQRAAELGRRVYVVPESDLNDVRVINPVDIGGYGLDAQWNDDFHHALHTLLTRERSGYYQDFGSIGHLEKAFREGFVYSGQYSAFRKRRHGSSSTERPSHQFVAFCQNHDQVGNRLRGERLSSLVPFEALKLAAGAVILSPYLPLLFMGEEYGETAPFHYFVSHSDPGLIEAVRSGRQEEFRHFNWEGEPPDPQDDRLFHASKLCLEKRNEGDHAVLLRFYKTLIRLRKEVSALLQPDDRKRLDISVSEPEKVLFMRRWSEDGRSGVFCILNFSDHEARVRVSLPDGEWTKKLVSSDKIWNGPGSLLPDTIRNKGTVIVPGLSFAAFTREKGQ